MIKAIPVAIPMNEERPWGLGRRYMLTSTGTLTRAGDLLFARDDDVARDLTRDLLLKPSCGTQALHQRGLHLSTWTIQTSLLGYKGGWFMMRHKRSVCADSRE